MEMILSNRPIPIVMIIFSIYNNVFDRGAAIAGEGDTGPRISLRGEHQPDRECHLGRDKDL